MKNIDKNLVMKYLENVYDPELKKDLVSLNMIKDVKIDDKDVTITVELTTPACPLKDKMKNDIIEEVKKIEEIENIHVEFTAKPKQNDTKIKLDNIKYVIGVGSGKGGVGKSTVAANIALNLAKNGDKVGLLDLDAYGPNIPQILNCNEHLQADGNKIIPLEKYNIKIVSIGLIIPADQAVIWRGPMLHKLVEQFMKDVQWGELDYLVIDLPPGTGDVQISLAQLVNVDSAVVVTTPQQLAVDDVRKAIVMYRQLQIDILGIVENMSYFQCPHCNEKSFIFSESGGENLAKDFNLKLLGQLPIISDFSKTDLKKQSEYFDEIISNLLESKEDIEKKYKD